MTLEERNKQQQQGIRLLEEYRSKLNFFTLPEEEKKKWLAANKKRLEDNGVNSDNYVEMVTQYYKNDLFKSSTFNIDGKTVSGKDVFDSLDWRAREGWLNEKVTSEAFNEYYKNNPNLAELQQLTSDGKADLIYHGYTPQEWINNEHTKDRAETDGQKRENAILSATIAGVTKSGTSNDLYDKLNDFPEETKAWEEKLNTRILEKVRNQDNQKKQSKVAPVKEALIKDWQHKINSTEKVTYKGQEMTYAQYIDKLFEQMAGGSEEEVTNPYAEELKLDITNTRKVKRPGSRYYKAFKDSDLMNENMTLDKKMEFLANYLAVSQEYGEYSAVSNMETQMQNFVADNQTWYQQLGYSTKNIALGALADLVNTYIGAKAAVIEATEGKEGLANYMEGKYADGSSRPLWDNVAYWAGVDMFNTLDWGEIQKAYDNGGISQYNNVYNTDEQYGAWATTNEVLKQSKYLLSNLIKARIMGSASKGLTKVTGGKFLPTGALDKANSTLTSRIVNKAGAYGTIGATAMSTSVVEGIHTYQQTVEEGNWAIDAQIDKEAEQYAQNILNSEKGKAAIENYVQRELEAAKKLAQENKGENGIFITPDEESLKKQGISLYTEILKQQYKENPANNHEEDRQYARIKAADAYMIDATLEEVRQAGMFGAFRKYLFSKSTRAALGGNNSLLGKVRDNGSGAMSLSKGAQRWHMAKKLATPAIEGFVDEYLDGVTADFSKGFGLGELNNYLANKYNPDAAKYGFDFLGNFLSGMDYGMKGALEASVNPQYFYEGMIGALGGSVSSVMARITPSERREAMETMGLKPEDNMTFMQKVNKWVLNPLLNNYYEAKAEIQQANEFLDLANKTIETHGGAIKDLNEVLSTAHRREVAVGEGGNTFAAKNAKAQQALNLVLTIDAWSKDPMLSQSKLVQEAQATIQGLANGTLSQEEEDALVTQFLGRPENAVIAKQDNAREEALTTLKKNASMMLDMQKTVNETAQTIERSSLGRRLSSDQKSQLIYQAAMGKNWKERMQEMEEEISGNKESTSDYVAEAEYGSRAAWERKQKAQTETVNHGREVIEKLEQELVQAKEDYKTANRKEKRELTPKIQALELRIQSAKEQQGLLENRLAQINSEEGLFTTIEGETLEHTTRVLSKEEILNLNPEQRAWMLDEHNLADYSFEQQQIIKDTIAELKRQDPDIMEKIKDVATLDVLTKANDAAYSKLTDEKNAVAAAYWAQGIIESRDRTIGNIYKQIAREKVDEIMDKAAIEDNKTGTKEATKAAAKTLGYAALKDYIERNPHTVVNLEGEEFTIEHPLQGIADALEIQETAVEAINSLFETAEDRQAASNIVYSYLKNAESAREAMSALEDALDDQTEEIPRQMVSAILNRLEELNFQRDSTKVANREELKKKAEEENKKKTEAKAQSISKWNGAGFKIGDRVTIDWGQEGSPTGTIIDFTEHGELVISTKDTSTGIAVTTNPDTVTLLPSEPKPEPSQNEGTIELGEEQVEIDLGIPDVETPTTPAESTIESTPDGDKISSPTVEIQGQQEGLKVQLITPTVPIETHNSTSPNLLTGNARVGYNYQVLVDKGQQVPSTGEAENDSKSQFFSWLEQEQIKLQEIVDNELANIYSALPDTKIQFLRINQKGSTLENEVLEVIEYTPEIAKLHNKDNGGIIEANGKSWLIVGVLGFNRANPVQINNYNNIKNTTQSEKDTYFEAYPNEKYFVSDSFNTKYHSGTNGRLVRQLSSDSEVQMRNITDLANGVKSERNPEGLAIEDLKWAIQQDKSFITIGLSNEENFYPPVRGEENVGNVFLMVKAANGTYIPAAIKPIMLDEINQESSLKIQIDNYLNQLTSIDYNRRKTAISELCKLLCLNDNENILIGTEKIPSLTIIQNGNKFATFTLGENFNRAEFIKTINNSKFRINITASTLKNPTSIRMYAEAGALQTDIAKLGTSNMVFDVYPCDSNGNPIITEDTWINDVQGARDRRLSQPRPISIMYKGKRYRLRTDGIFYDETENPVDINSAQHQELYWSHYISSNNLESAITDKGWNYYIINTDPKSALVVKRDSRGNIKIADTDTSLKTITAIQEKIARETRVKNAEEALVDIEEQETPEPSISIEETLTPEQIAEQTLGDFSSETPAPASTTSISSETTQEEQEKQEQKQEEKIQDNNKSSENSSTKADVNTPRSISLNALQNTEEIHTFAAAMASSKHRRALQEIFKEKKWPCSSKAEMEKIFKEKGISTEFSTFDDFCSQLKNCF